MSVRDEELREALNRPSPYGPDLDLSSYLPEAGEKPEEPGQEVSSVGIDPRGEGRAGSFVQVDHSALYAKIQKMYEDSVEILSFEDAVKRYDWLQEYVWKAVSPTADKYTAFTALKGKGGYFIRVLEGKEVVLPLQACLYVRTRNLLQAVHNLILMERDSSAQLLTGCLTHPQVERGFHIGISEFYLKRGSKLTFTMVHHWGPKVDVRPRTGVVMEDESTFVSNYIALTPVASLQAYPRVRMMGKKASATLNSIVYGRGSSQYDLGGWIEMMGSSNKGEIVGRTVTAEESRVLMRARLTSLGKDNVGHVECNGLMLSPQSEISAVPELVSRSSTSTLTHEAAVGKLNEEQVLYLMSRGLGRKEAEDLLIRGFLDVRILKLPEFLQQQVERIVQLAMGRGL
ncbi:MAG: SufD family Fe-S cluster assembly protein [Candidatus Hadarchaeales archaeon]